MMPDELFTYLRRRLGPLFDPNDDPAGSVAPDDNANDNAIDDTAAPEPTPEPIDNDIDDGYVPLDPQRAEREAREAEFQERLNRIEQDAAAAARQREDTAAQAAAQTGNDIDNPFANVSKEDLDNDPVLRGQYWQYQRELKRDKDFTDLRNEMRSIKADIDNSKKAGQERTAVQSATQRADELIRRATARHPLFNNQKDATHKKRLSQITADVHARAAGWARQGVTTDRIALEIERMLPGYIRSAEEFIGMAPSKAALPPAEDPHAAANRRDTLARNSINAPGAPPPSRDREPIIGDDAESIYTEFQKRMQAAT